MATGEDEAQAVIGKIHGVSINWIFRARGRVSFLQQTIVFFLTNPIAPHEVHDFAARHRGDPRCWIPWHATHRPVSKRGREGLLHGLLREVEGAANSDEAGDDDSGFLPKDRLNGRAQISHLRCWQTPRSRRDEFSRGWDALPRSPRRLRKR